MRRASVVYAHPCALFVEDRKVGRHPIRASRRSRTAWTAAKAQGVSYTEQELTRHTGITICGVSTTVARQAEIPDMFAETIFRQLEPVLGKGWWRQ